jgi:hypothetical protein
VVGTTLSGAQCGVLEEHGMRTTDGAKKSMSFESENRKTKLPSELAIWGFHLSENRRGGFL